MNKIDNHTHDSCLICSSKRIETLEKYKKHFLVQCKDCSFVFSERIPTNDELIAHYNTYGRTDYLSPITVKRYHEILDFLEPYRKTNNLIDVGCGIGHFLTIAKERGWNVYGTEFTDEAIKICKEKGIIMNQGVLDSNNYLDDFFDVVVSIEVIEHINNPIIELNNFKKILRKGGAVYLTTPNFNSISRYILKEKWNVIEYPEHLCYYTPKTLNYLFSNKGFEKKWIQTTGINTTRLTMSISGEKEPKKDSEGKNISVTNQNTSYERLRNVIEKNRVLIFLKWLLNEILSFFQKGDNLKVLYIKK